MAFQAGHNAYFNLDAADITAYCDTQSLNRVRAVLETTPFGVSDTTSMAGIRSHTLSIGGPWDPTGDATLDGADDGAVVAFVFGPEGNTSGDIQYTGNALFADYNISTSVSGRVAWSANFTPSGAVTRATV